MAGCSGRVLRELRDEVERLKASLLGRTFTWLRRESGWLEMRTQQEREKAKAKLNHLTVKVND